MKIKKYILSFGLIVIVVIGFYAYFILGNQARTVRGLQKAREYSEKMYSDYQIAGESCQGEDTNGDGYVTCNFRLKQIVTSQERTISLQCPTFIKSFMATSCKEQGMVINNQ